MQNYAGAATIENCRNVMCKNQIHDKSEFRRKMLYVSKMLQGEPYNLGPAEAQNHPLYRELMHCSPNSFPDDRIVLSPQECNRRNGNKKRSSVRSKRKRCGKGTRRNPRTGNCEAPDRNAPPKRRKCPNGTRKHRKTGECVRR